MSECLPQAHRYVYDASLRRVCRRCGKVFWQDAAPKRIQRKRERGWRMPEGAVYVGRPSLWGNPWHVHRTERRQWVVMKHGVVDASFLGTFDSPEAASYWATQGFRRDFDPDPTLLSPLKGHDLACWCPLDRPCHADVLLKVANA